MLWTEGTVHKVCDESQTHRSPSHQLHRHYVSCRASNEDAGPWDSRPRLLPTLTTPAPPQGLVGYTGHNHQDRESAAWEQCRSLDIYLPRNPSQHRPSWCREGPRDSSYPPSSRALGSQFSELRQQTLQQAPRLGAMTALLSPVLYPTLQLLLSEDPYDIVSRCPFRFLGLCLATPSAWGLSHNPMERPALPCKQCVAHSSETLWSPWPLSCLITHHCDGVRVCFSPWPVHLLVLHKHTIPSKHTMTDSETCKRVEIYTLLS